MKIIIAKNILIDPLQKVAKAASKNTAIQILTGIYIKADKRGLTLIGSELDITIQTFIPLEKFKIERNGEIVIAAKALIDIIKKLPDKDITIEVTHDFRVELTSGKAKLDIGGLDPEEYPNYNAVKTDHETTIDGAMFRNLINKTAFAVYKKEDNAQYTGVFIQFLNNKIQFTAADKARVARAYCETESEFEAEVLISGKTLAEIESLICDNDEVKLCISQNQFTVETYDYIAHCRVMAFKYPDLGNLLAKESSCKVILQRKSFIDSIELVQLTANSLSEGGAAIRIQADPEGINLSSAGDFGKSSYSIEAIQVEGKPFIVSTNSRNLLEALRVIDHKDVEIKFSSNMEPVVIYGCDEEKSAYIVFPYRAVV